MTSLKGTYSFLTCAAIEMTSLSKTSLLIPAGWRRDTFCAPYQSKTSAGTRNVPDWKCAKYNWNFVLSELQQLVSCLPKSLLCFLEEKVQDERIFILKKTIKCIRLIIEYIVLVLYSVTFRLKRVCKHCILLLIFHVLS